MAKRKNEETGIVDESNKAVVEAPAEPAKPRWADELVYLRSTSHAAAGWVLGANREQCFGLFAMLVCNANSLPKDTVVSIDVADDVKGPVPGDLVLVSLKGDGSEPIAQVPFQSIARKPSN